MINLTLNYPPSVNTYWGFHGHRRYLTKKANDFKAHVSEKVIESCAPKLGKARIELTITLCPPDKRTRDLDNVLKCLIDAICQAGVFDDDEQVDVLMVQRGEITKGGKALVMIEVLPPK